MLIYNVAVRFYLSSSVRLRGHRIHRPPFKHHIYRTFILLQPPPTYSKRSRRRSEVEAGRHRQRVVVWLDAMDPVAHWASQVQVPPPLRAACADELL